MSTAPSMSTISKFVVPSTSKFPLKSALPPNVKVVAMSTAPSISTTSKFVIPSTSKSPPTFKSLPIPTPPSTTSAPSPSVSESISFFILTCPLCLTSELKVTGPSNCDRILLDFPPSTTSLSLIVTSSNTTLNREGSSPATVGTGLSNVVSSPVSADFF